MSYIDGGLYVRGTLKADQMVLPDNSVGNSEFDAASPLDATKQQQQYTRVYDQPKAAAFNEERPIHQCFAVGSGVGTLIQIQAAALVAALGDSTVTIDLLKNGVSVLSSTIVLNSSVAAFTAELGTIATPTYSGGEVFSVKVTISAGTGTLPQGIIVTAVFREPPQ